MRWHEFLFQFETSFFRSFVSRKTMCRETPRPGMGSEPAVNTAKLNAKPLNPDAEPFWCRNNLFLRLTHEIYGGPIEGPYQHAQLTANMVPLPLPSLLPPQQETGFPCVYGDGNVMLIPNSLEAVNGFVSYQGGYLFNDQSLHASYDARCNRVNLPDNINAEVCNRVRKGRSTRSTGPPPPPALRSQKREKTRNKSLVQKNGANGGGASAGDHHSIIPFPLTLEEAENMETTTVMIKNIPYHYRFNDLRRILDDYCWEQNHQCADPSLWAKYDFLYLPMDYIIHARDSKLSNLGYAFVNFTTSRAAFKFFQQFHGHKWDESRKNKPCEITSARLQGKEILKNIFQRKIFRSKCPKFRPVEYSPARDGFNVRIKGIPVGIYVHGLPRRNSIGS